jgi:hypothetical protein
MKFSTPLLSACILGCAAFPGCWPSQDLREASQTTEAASPANPVTAHRIENEPQPVQDKIPQSMRYDVVETKDYSLISRRRISVKIVTKDMNADFDEIRAMLLAVALKQHAHAVLAYAYRPGDDWQERYTAGMLEWGKNGHGWASTTHLPPEGKFDAGEASSVIVSEWVPKQDSSDSLHDVAIYNNDVAIYNKFIGSIRINWECLKRTLKQVSKDGDCKKHSLKIFLCFSGMDDDFAKLKSQIKTQQMRNVYKARQDEYRRFREQVLREFPAAEATLDAFYDMNFQTKLVEDRLEKAKAQRRSLGMSW